MKGFLFFINSWKRVGFMCLILGLAPFYPEPHVVGKINWVLGGANGMQLMDWLDLAWHGFPWLLMLRIVILKSFKLIRR